MVTINDPRLVFDAASHRYSLAGQELLSVTAILTEARIADFSAPWFTEAIRDRGALVHQAIALRAGQVEASGLIDAVLREDILTRVFGHACRLDRSNGEYRISLARSGVNQSE